MSLMRSRLPHDRTRTGTVVIEDGGVVVAGPFVCYGKADNQEAAKHGNPDRDPTQPNGDHPTGSYQIAAIQHDKEPAHSYGPVFFLLEPTGGDALIAKKNGRAGLAAHGGDQRADGSLRPTFGCLRMRNEDILATEPLVTVGMQYICEEM